MDVDTGNLILNGYTTAAPELIETFEAVSSAKLYAPVQQFLPRLPCRVLDLGAGTGRDAAWFANAGHKVVAVEPVAPFRQTGFERHPSPRIAWVDDTLPDIHRVLARNEIFDLIILSAVWQHLDDSARKVALFRLRALTVNESLVILSIRHGPGAASRPIYKARIADVILWANSAGFRLVFETRAPSVQSPNNKAGVTWSWLVLRAV